MWLIQGLCLQKFVTYLSLLIIPKIFTEFISEKFSQTQNTRVCTCCQFQVFSHPEDLSLFFFNVPRVLIILINKRHKKCYFCLYKRLKLYSKLSWILSSSFWSGPYGVSFRKVSLHCLGVLIDGYLNDVQKKKVTLRFHCFGNNSEAEFSIQFPRMQPEDL